ncbi:DUF6044 family protein [Fictibacillus enclensis]|uniref:DUF6044 family protein n=1 Tax=Fictibacillus enclensis TaxID=1017270 RepID=UPI0024C0CCD6|nr:DUF6044 family protein [Fictibacillus enclensis]WHY73593.1 DUF6044 family protein [Fictibacillus enclensis]
MFRGNQLKETQYLTAAVIVLLIYLSPLFILGDNAHIRVHDNMDSNITWYKELNESGQLFGPLNAVIPQVINGVPRDAFDSEFSGIVWLHTLFPSMLAYAFSQAITRVIAFIGMYLLLRKHFIKEEGLAVLRVGASLAFALTPFWPSGMLSTLGMPLALWAFLNIRNRTSGWKEWLVLFCLPFYSSFVLGFFFFLAFMTLLWMIDVYRSRQWNGRFLLSIIFMAGMYLLTEYRLVFSLLLPQPPTNRNEFDESVLDGPSSMKLMLKNFLLGHTHVMTIHTYFILPLLIMVLWNLIKENKWRNEKTFVYLMILNVLLSVWYGFWFYKGWEPIKAHISLLRTFNFSRFHFLHPLLWYLLFAIGLRIFWKGGGKGKKAAVVFLILQLTLLFTLNEEVRYRIAGYPSFKEFYSVQLFKKIDTYIGKPKSSYRVASLGLHPAIAQYNGFYTVDTYNNFYPLSYKHQFRSIIAKELDKSPKLKSYFDHWGGRCYLYSAELGEHYDYEKTSTKQIHQLQLNIQAFKKLGGRYIFSAVPVKNAKQDHLVLKKVFTDPHSVWKIYLYQTR